MKVLLIVSLLFAASSAAPGFFDWVLYENEDDIELDEVTTQVVSEALPEEISTTENSVDLDEAIIIVEETEAFSDGGQNETIPEVFYQSASDEDRAQNQIVESNSQPGETDTNVVDNVTENASVENTSNSNDRGDRHQHREDHRQQNDEMRQMIDNYFNGGDLTKCSWINCYSECLSYGKSGGFCNYESQCICY